MVTVTRTYLVDDLDGSEEDVENVLLALDGTNYEIDLSASNAGRLREKLERFVAAASPVKAAKSVPARRGPRGKAATSAKTAPVPSNRDQVQAIREWAKSAGYEVSARGRISKAIQEAFDAAH
ncbi:MAG TPA: Lsr2 family protein [Dermatophilaceae bacterium]|nr:Lsr2 family protein [Dermatophilaceae bacterium]